MSIDIEIIAEDEVKIRFYDPNYGINESTGKMKDLVIHLNIDNINDATLLEISDRINLNCSRHYNEYNVGCIQEYHSIHSILNFINKYTHENSEDINSSIKKKLCQSIDIKPNFLSEEVEILNDISSLNNKELAYFLSISPGDKFFGEFTLYSLFSPEKKLKIQEKIKKGLADPEFGENAKTALIRLIQECKISDLYSVKFNKKNIDGSYYSITILNDMIISDFIASFKENNIESMTQIYLKNNIYNISYLFSLDVNFISALAYLEKNNTDLISDKGKKVFQLFISNLEEDAKQKMVELAEKYKLTEVLELCQSSSVASAG